MCYPCSGCNGCGKMDSELFNYMTPRLRCMNCGAEYTIGEDTCTECGWELPRLPGEHAWQREGETEALTDSTQRS
jgi:rRNA maturation endonuclease Nob1